MPDCCVCGTEHKREACHIIVLTEAERAHVENPQDEYIYCKPCWGVLSDPNAAPALMSGIVKHHLKQSGVADADGIAAHYQAILLKKAVRRS